MGIRAKRAERNANQPAPTHACGDPNAEMPGDRPESYSATLTADAFYKRGGSFEDEIAAVYYNDGTQSYGKLKPGFKPAVGYEVDADGMVVKSPK